MRRSLTFVSLIAAAALAAPAATLAADQAAADSPGTNTRCRNALKRNDGWSFVPAPLFPRGNAYFVAYALDPADPRTVFATNGQAVMRSRDAACTWTGVYDAVPNDPRGEAAPPQSISLLATTRGGNPLVYFTVTRRPLGSTQTALTPTVVVSRDAGATWTEVNRGLPLTGSVTALAFHDDGLRGYAVIDGALPPSGEEPRQLLFTTADGGERWTVVPNAPGNLTGLRAGVAPDELWAWDAGRVYRSVDAGATLSAVPALGSEVHDLEYSLPAGSAATSPALAAATGKGVLTTTAAAGADWVPRRVPAKVVDSVAYDVSDNTVIAAGPQGTWWLSGNRPARRVTPAGGVYLHDVALVRRSRAREVWGLTPAGVFQGVLSPKLGVVVPPPPRPLPVIPPIELKPGSGPMYRSPTLRPRHVDVPLRLGESQTVRYTFDLPPTPTPLDVLFLVDTTSSFQPVINGLRQQLANIVNRLTAEGIDAQFGVGGFRDYPVSAYSGGPSNYAYRLMRKIGPVNDELENAFYALRAENGTVDGRTSALAAEYQAATGAGQRVAPTPTRDGYTIPSGLDAKFRRDSVRVILLVTDTEPRNAEPGYPGPSKEQVADALAGRDIYQLGLVVGKPPSGVAGPRATMEWIARETRALAPRNGVDCDGDGNPEIDAGEPLVCNLFGSGIAEGVLGLLRGVRDEAEVSLTAEVSGDPRVVVPLSVTEYDAVNLRAYSRIWFDLAFVCFDDIAGRVVPVELVVESRARRLARATASVQCEPKLPPEEAAQRPIRPLVAAAIAPLAPPPPPAPIPQPQPLPNPNLNPQAQPNPMMQAGMAAQEEQQHQLAFVTDEVRTNAEGELAMSDYRRKASPDPALLLGSAVILGGAFAAAQRRRSQLVPARVRRRGR